MLQRQGDAPCLGCSVYYAAVGHVKGTWSDGIGAGILMACVVNSSAHDYGLYMAYIPIACIRMACILMQMYGYGLYSYGLYSYGPV